MTKESLLLVWNNSKLFLFHCKPTWLNETPFRSYKATSQKAVNLLVHAFLSSIPKVKRLLNNICQHV